MLDYLQVIFWSVTYILIIIAGFKSQRLKMVSMPYMAGVLNFAWEAIALKNSAGNDLGHILWFSLDVVIVYISYKYLDDKKMKIIYVGMICAFIVLLNYIFEISDGMLISVFVIDIIMAVVYLLRIKKISPYLKIHIAVTKLIGDTFAGLFYAEEMKLIAVIALLVFVCNTVYLILCIIEYKTTDKKEYYQINKHKKKRKKKPKRYK